MEKILEKLREMGVTMRGWQGGVGAGRGGVRRGEVLRGGVWGGGVRRENVRRDEMWRETGDEVEGREVRESAFAKRDGGLDDDVQGESESKEAFGSKSALGADVGNEMGVPQTEIEFVEMIKRMPEKALSQEGRRRVAAVMSFDEKMVRDLMVPRGRMIFVKKDEVLGPLVLDKLYQSGFTSFPVVDERDEVLGIIHTEALNALEIREADKAVKYLDPNVQYLRTNDSLLEAVEKMEQTGGFYYLVRAENGLVVGSLTVGMVLEYLLGK